MRGVDQLAVLRIGLGALDDAAHHRDRGLRMLAGGGFGRQHDGVRAVVDGGGHVGGLGARGHGALDHGFQHLRGDDHRLAGAAAAAHGALLDRGHLFGRQFHAQVAARHHQRVGLGDDLVQPLDRRGLLQLGDDAGAVADPFAGLDDVLGPLHEGQRDPVGAQRQRRVQVAQVLGVSAEIGSTTPGTLTPLRSDSRPPTSTRVSALVASQASTRRRRRPSSSSSSAPGASAAKISGGAGRRARRCRGAGPGPGGSAGRAAIAPAPARRRPRAAWALQVGHHADGAAGLGLDLAQDGHADRVILGAAVAEVQPEHVHAGMEQAAEGIAVAAGRTQRGDDLGAAVAA